MPLPTASSSVPAPEPAQSAPPPRAVLLYDGECGLCNAAMRFLLKRDRRGVVFFAPLQGATAQAFLPLHGLNTRDFDSLVFIEDLRRADTRFHLRTDGALGAFEMLGGGYAKLAKTLRVIPRPLRDAIYKIVARLRYRLFGEYKPTPLPNPDWTRRILE